MNAEQLKRFEASIVTLEDKHKEIAKNYILAMRIKYGVNCSENISLDDFLYGFADVLRYYDLKLGESILNLLEL